MLVGHLRINHLENPLGYEMKTVTASYRVTEALGKRQEYARIRVSLDPQGKEIVYDTGKARWVSGQGTRLPLCLMPCTRYYWKVWVWDDEKEEGQSPTAWFETGRMDLGLQGKWITAGLEEGIPILEKSFLFCENCTKARLYICGLGVFEAWLNGRRIGEEILTPYLTSYESHTQYITFDVGDYIRQGENTLQVYLAGGWYLGSYGYRQNPDWAKGRKPKLLLTMDLYGESGAKTTIVSDPSWKYRISSIVYSDIYNGEFWDDNREEALLSQGPALQCPVEKEPLPAENVRARLSVPVGIQQTIKPAALLQTPAGELVLDMGQNITGRITFRCRGQRGAKYVFTHGEILQKGCFYRDNYRTAKAEYIYISDGREKTVFPRFTFYGFRYVKITDGNGKPPKDIFLEDFTGQVLTSHIEETGKLQTGNQLFNRLINNIMWSQRDNFLDVPTDCPQRDERLGWTGDAQIFARTACLNGECYGFFRKYLYDIWMEQRRYQGMAPQIVPYIGRSPRTSAGWGDAAVMIPWVLYTTYADASILEEQWESMVAWVKYIDRCNQQAGTDPDLWQNGFHYGDWLAFDGGCYHMPVGGTETFYISSAYFFRAVQILHQAAKALGKKEEEVFYGQKAARIKDAIQREYFTRSGRLCMDTQTGYAVALVFQLYQGEEQRRRLSEGLAGRIRRDHYQLKTGFVGTPLLLPALSEVGLDKIAMRLLLQEECPGWLYQVKLGATTVWERWDSVKPDGSMSDTGMNSLNHYANGSVLEWIYGRIGGVRPLREDAGYGMVRISPLVSPQIGWASMALNTAWGCYRIKWEIRGERTLYLKCRIPFGAKAEICLPYPDSRALEKYGACQEREAGEYEYCYDMTLDFMDRPSLEDSVRELVKTPQIKDYLYRKVPMLAKVDGADIQDMTLNEMAKLPFFLGIGTDIGLDDGTLEEIGQWLANRKKADNDK